MAGPAPLPQHSAHTPRNKPCFNCIVLPDSSIHELNLSSQANTGLKIPPGEVVGGPISVAAGQNVELNIDFNACASIILEGNGQYRLKPVLMAEQVSMNNTGISGQVVKAGTVQPISGGTVMVALEKQDGTGTDVIYEQAVADSSGNFNFCTLPSGATFDVVVVAIDGGGVAYHATVAAPASGDVLYSIRANAFVPMSGGTTDCMPSSTTIDQDSGSNPLKALPGPPITPKEIDFTGCS